MPLVIAVAVALLAALGFVALLPLTLVLRYRAGTARRLSRGWVAAINTVAFGISATLFLCTSALTNVWVPRAFAAALLGMSVGAALGIVGLAVTRWERTSAGLYYTPNRWLVLTITLVILARLGYGFWRFFHAWRFMSGGDESWLVAAGIAGSLAAGASVVGYYLAYWVGLWARFRAHRREASTAAGAAR